MKRYILLFVLLLTTMGAMAQTVVQGEVEWPLEPKNELAKYLIDIDNYSKEAFGERVVNEDVATFFAEENNESVDSSKQSIQDTYAEADALWHKFIWLCNEDRVEEAVELYKDNSFMIDIAISHSEVRLLFHEEVLGYLLYQHLPEKEAATLLAQAFGLDFVMIGFKYQNTPCPEGLEIYNHVMELLLGQYDESQQYDSMFSTIDTWADTSGYNDTLYGQAVALFKKVRVYYYSLRDYAAAKSCLLEAKDLLERFHKENSDVDVSDGIESINQMLQEVELAEAASK